MKGDNPSETGSAARMINVPDPPNAFPQPQYVTSALAIHSHTSPSWSRRERRAKQRKVQEKEAAETQVI